MAEAYAVKKGYLKQGEYHSGEAVLHAENVATSENQLTILVRTREKHCWGTVVWAGMGGVF